MKEGDFKGIILAVDDEPMNLEFLKAVLEPEGYFVVLAQNGEEALDHIRSRQIDLVLLDILMPGIDGVEVCRRIKEDLSTAFIPVVMVTALDAVSDRVRAIEAGADDFLSKPVDRQELLARTRSLLRSKFLLDKLENAYHTMTSVTSMSASALRLTEEMDIIPFDIGIELAKSFLSSSDINKGPRSLFLGKIRGETGAEGTFFHREEAALEWKSWFIPLEELAKQHIMEGIDSRADAISEGTGNSILFDSESFSPTAWVSDGSFLVIATDYPQDANEFDREALKTLVLNTSFFQSISKHMQETEEAFRYTIEALARAAVRWFTTSWTLCPHSCYPPSSCSGTPSA